MASCIRESLGRYQIEAELGRGAMGVVYRARDPKIDRIVAIKTISLGEQDATVEQDYRERFAQEARAAGRLAHPGIVTVFDAGEDSDTHEPFLVMEYIAGKPLNRLMAEAGGRLPLHAAMQFACEIADALAYAHSQGVIHRDIKPANILITDDMHAKIADFGVAGLLHTATAHGGEVLGSPAYMAPEQLNRGQADARSDLFSLGVVLYSMITGFRPFQGNSAATVCFKVMNFEPVPVTSFQADLPPGLDTIVSKAIAKDPDERYQSGTDLATDIRAFMGGDAAMQEATRFFARTLEATARAANEERMQRLADRIALSRRFWWQAFAAAIIAASGLTAWQVKQELREANAIPPPAILAAPAPPVQKAPRSATPGRKAPVRPKAPAKPVAETATVRVEILHHFSEGKASIWIDRHLVFAHTLHQNTHRHPLFRTVEMNEIANLQFVPGRHTLEVRVEASANNYDQSRTIDATLASGPEHVLYVNCDKRDMQVDLQ